MESTGPLHDGDTISSGLVYRRIYPDKSSFQDGTCTSAIWAPRPGEELSAYLATMVTPDDVLRDHDNYGLVAIDIADLVAAGLSVYFRPADGFGHVGIASITKSIRKRLKDAPSLQVIREPRVVV